MIIPCRDNDRIRTKMVRNRPMDYSIRARRPHHGSHFVMSHDSAWTALTVTFDAIIEVVNIIVMLLYMQETVLEAQVGWLSYHSTDVLN